MKIKMNKDAERQVRKAAQAGGNQLGAQMDAIAQEVATSPTAKSDAQIRVALRNLLRKHKLLAGANINGLVKRVKEFRRVS